MLKGHANFPTYLHATARVKITLHFWEKAAMMKTIYVTSSCRTGVDCVLNVKDEAWREGDVGGV